MTRPVKRKTRHVALATIALLSSLMAATVFLCMRPAAAPAAEVADGAAHPAMSQRANAPTAAAAAIAAGELVNLSDRHASDALRIAAHDIAQNTAGDDLGWDYVQLRL